MERYRDIKTPKDHQQMMRKRNNENAPTPPAWVNRTPAPSWNVPYAQQYRPAPAPMRHRNGYHTEVEQSLKNMEKLLEQVIDILKKK
jgi:hypothetical protein